MKGNECIKKRGYTHTHLESKKKHGAELIRFLLTPVLSVREETISPV